MYIYIRWMALEMKYTFFFLFKSSLCKYHSGCSAQHQARSNILRGRRRFIVLWEEWWRFYTEMCLENNIIYKCKI